MNVFYEEEGSFRIGAILADNDTSLQVQAPHGKRSKVKASNVLFRFNEPLAGFMEGAQKAAADMDLDFLWECCAQEEFSYDKLARDYFGHTPAPGELAAVLLRLHSAPMYFYRKGRGRYRPAPPEALKAALASVERKRQQAALQAQYVEQLRRFELPEAFRPRLAELLYKPDRSTVEVKALEDGGQPAQALDPAAAGEVRRDPLDPGLSLRSLSVRALPARHRLRRRRRRDAAHPTARLAGRSLQHR